MWKMPETMSGARARDCVSGCKEEGVYKTFLGDRSNLCLLKSTSYFTLYSDVKLPPKNSHATSASYSSGLLSREIKSWCRFWLARFVHLIRDELRKRNVSASKRFDKASFRRKSDAQTADHEGGARSARLKGLNGSTLIDSGDQHESISCTRRR